MKTMKDLPLIALEKICMHLSMVDKINLIRAAEADLNFASKIDKLCYKKRGHFCPFCILFMGTDFKPVSRNYAKTNLHNQLLTFSSGDENWSWKNTVDGLKIIKTSDDFDYAIGVYAPGNIWKPDLLYLIEKPANTYNPCRINLLNHVLSFYNSSTCEFDSEIHLYNHIIQHHHDLIPTSPLITTVAELKLLLKTEFMIRTPTISISCNSHDNDFTTVLNCILFKIAVNYLGFKEHIEKSLSMRTTVEIKEKYFYSQVSMIFRAAIFTLENCIFEQQPGLPSIKLDFVIRLRKLYECLSAIFDSFE